MKRLVTISIFAIISLTIYAQDTVMYVNGANLCDDGQEFNFKLENDTLAFWGRIKDYCGSVHYFVTKISNDTIRVERYNPNPMDCYGNFVFYTKIPNCILNSYKFTLEDIYPESNDGLDTIITNSISSTIEYLDTIIYSSGVNGDITGVQDFNISLENDTITFSGKVAASLTTDNHYFIIEKKNNTIVLDRYTSSVCEANGLFDFAIKIPDCTQNSYQFILKDRCGYDGINTVVSPTNIEKCLYKNNCKIYPNPSDGEVAIVVVNITSTINTAEIRITDINGKFIKSIPIENCKTKYEIKTIIWKKGTYLCALIVDGKVYGSKKLIVK